MIRQYAFYNPTAGRIEIHLVSLVEQTVNVAGQRFHFNLGEALFTENPYKFHCDEFSAIAASADWHLLRDGEMDGVVVQLYGGLPCKISDTAVLIAPGAAGLMLW